MRHVAVLLPLAFVATAPLAAAEPVAVPAFNSVELRGGGNVVVRPGPASVTLLKGSTAFTHFRVDAQGQLKIDACNAQCPRNYDLEVEIRYPKVLPMAIAELSGNAQQDRGVMMAAVALSILPILILYMVAQRWFIEGIAMSGQKVQRE